MLHPFIDALASLLNVPVADLPQVEVTASGRKLSNALINYARLSQIVWIGIAGTNDALAAITIYGSVGPDRILVCGLNDSGLPIAMVAVWNGRTLLPEAPHAKMIEATSFHLFIRMDK